MRKQLPALDNAKKLNDPDLNEIGSRNYTDTILKYGGLATTFPQLDTNAKTIVAAINELYNGGGTGTDIATITYDEWEELSPEEQQANDYVVIDAPVVPISGAVIPFDPDGEDPSISIANYIYDLQESIISDLQLSEMSDVELSDLRDGDILSYTYDEYARKYKWVNKPLSLDTLSDVGIYQTPEEEEILIYHYSDYSGTYEWTNRKMSLDYIDGVYIDSEYKRGQVLKNTDNDDLHFTNEFLNLSELGDVYIASRIKGYILQYDGYKWTAVDPNTLFQ